MTVDPVGGPIEAPADSAEVTVMRAVSFPQVRFDATEAHDAACRFAVEFRIRIQRV